MNEGVTASSRLATQLVDRIAAGSFVRSVNFHCTPAETADSIERRLAAWAERYVPLHVDVLDEWFDGAGMPAGKPGLILAFFNGYRDNYEIAAPLLERYGFVGWFFVPTAWLTVPEAQQRDYARESGMGLPAAILDDTNPGRLALTWNEVRDLQRRGHVIAGHTQSHVRVDATEPTRLADEIVGSQRDLERELGAPAKAFAWLQGSPYGQDPRADALLLDAGYRFLFSNLKIERLPKLPRSTSS